MFTSLSDRGSGSGSGVVVVVEITEIPRLLAITHAFATSVVPVCDAACSPITMIQ